MRNVLVTGAGGFLGRTIVAQLMERGDQVRAFGRRHYPDLERSGVELCQGDVRDRAAVTAACRGVDLVIHAAAVAGIWGPWDRYYSINTLGTENVLQACLRNKVPRLVYTSSPSVTFDGRPQEGVDETVPYASKWLCHYPHSKALAEQQVLHAATQGDILACALRPHLIWGPNDPHLIARLLERARRGQLRQVGDGTNRIDIVYLDNAAEAHLMAADALQPGSPAVGRAYFISQGQPVNCWQWINDILRLAGLPVVKRRVPFGVAWQVGHLLEIVHGVTRRSSEPRMTRFLAAQLAHSHYFDIRRAEQDLGYSPRISIEKGMQLLAAHLAGQR